MASELPRALLDYYQRVGAEVLNWRRALIKQEIGAYYVERAVIKIAEDGSVSCSDKESLPTPEEAKAIAAEWIKCEFPRIIRARTIEDLLPKLRGEYFVFRDRATQESGSIQMVQEKRIKKNGQKAYIPWVLMSDGEWRSMEPEGGLPFWKPTRAQSDKGKIMIHEGAKAAAFVTDRLEAGGWDHPWAEELAQWTHFGMIGGAMAPHRTDYGELEAEKPGLVCYVCDNDDPGISALQIVSRMWDGSMRAIVFGDDFPKSWDMADAMPAGLFKGERYRGKSLASFMKPATFATEIIPNPSGKGRPVTILRRAFATEWRHTVTPEAFLHKDWPHKIMTADEFDNEVAPFSQSAKTSTLLQGEFVSKALVEVHAGAALRHF